MAAYYASHAANGPGRWLGRGADALGFTGQAADPEQFRRGILGLRRRRRPGPTPRSAFIRRAPSRPSRSPPRSASSPPSEGSPRPTCSVRPVGQGVGDCRGPPTSSRRRRHRRSPSSAARPVSTRPPCTAPNAHINCVEARTSARPPAGPAAVPQQVLDLSAMGFGFGSEVPWDCAPFARRRKLG